MTNKPIACGATEAELKTSITSYVRRRDYVSFAELASHFGNEDFTEGHNSLLFDDKVTLWSGLSERAVRVMVDLINERAVVPYPSSVLVYLVDGRALGLPVAKAIKVYRKPHWLPVVLRPPARAPTTSTKQHRRNVRRKTAASQTQWHE